jgi:hypothetical protein
MDFLLNTEVQCVAVQTNTRFSGFWLSNCKMLFCIWETVLSPRCTYFLDHRPELEDNDFSPSYGLYYVFGPRLSLQEDAMVQCTL